MNNTLHTAIAQVVKQLFDQDVQIVLTRPEEKFGDYATNIAMQLSGRVGKNPREVAEQIAEKLRDSDGVKSVAIAGPGFINISLTDQAVFTASQQPIQQRSGSMVLEYSCPNPFKELHVGHLYQTILGDALGRVYERLGLSVSRLNFGGDVGLHVAKSMWAMLKELDGENPDALTAISHQERSSWLAKVYVAGAQAYEDSDNNKQEIVAINKRIYELHNTEDKQSNFAKIYWETRAWSYDYFGQFYSELGVIPFDRYIGESETFKPGLSIVQSHIGDVFEESDGAVVLTKEKSGLHTRVFINSEGLPTYETKDLGVIKIEHDAYNYDTRIIMTGNDQKEYMKVVFAAMKLANPEIGNKQISLTHGTVRFGDGKKMSSRLGNVTRAVDVITVTKETVEADSNELRDQIALGAVKYTFLKNSIGDDMSFDLERAVSMEGNSGPYLQYALVRARNILRKIGETTPVTDVYDLDEQERRLASWLSRYNEVLTNCADQRSLHYLCVYLYELAQVFNRFYESSRVIDHERSQIRAELVKRYVTTLTDGLNCLGIPQPEHM